MFKRFFAFLLLALGFVLPVSAFAANYVIQYGDTLTSIARRFNTTVDTLVSVNGIKNADRIFAGDVLDVESEDPVIGAGYTPVTGYQSRTTSYIAANATTIPVASTRDKAGNQIVLSDISASSTVRVFMSLATGTAKEEILYCTGVTASSWTGCVRGLSFQGGDATASSTLAFAHNAGTSIIITDVGQFFSEFVDMSSSQTIFGTKTFNTLPRATSTSSLCGSNNEFCTKYYIDNVGAGGFTAANVSTTRGISVDGSAPERLGVNASTTRGLAFDNNGTSNWPLYINASSTGGINFSSSGTIQVDQSDNFNFTGTVTGTRFRTDAVPSNGSDVVNLTSQDNAVRNFVATSTAAVAITSGQAIYLTTTSTALPTNTGNGTSTFFFVGFATANASAAAQVTYTRPGGVNCNQSGLTPGAYYYANGSAGAISTANNTTYSARVGLALSATCIQVLQPKYTLKGSVSTGTASNGSTFRVNSFFYPAKVASAAYVGATAASIVMDTDAASGVVPYGGTAGGSRGMGADQLYFQDEGGNCYWRGDMVKDLYGFTVTNNNFSGAGCGNMLDMTVNYTVSSE